MPKTKIIYQANQEVIGKHLQSKEWVMYSGKLIIYDRKTNPVILKLNSEIYDTFIGEFMEEKKRNLKENLFRKYLEELQNGILKMVLSFKIDNTKYLISKWDLYQFRLTVT